jgi:acyl-CoA thioesterase I
MRSCNRIPWAFVAFWLIFPGCGREPARDEPARSAGVPPVAATAPEPAVPDARKAIVAFGDSLTAGLGVLPEENYPSQLQRKLDGSGFNYRVVNAGVSGETSSQGLSRLDVVLGQNPSIVIVELGANDGLRGIPVEVTASNLDQIAGRLRASGAQVVLAGMEMPPNFGPAYTAAFREIFPAVARKHRVPLVPFFLAGVGGISELNQDDGIHPTSRGYSIVAETVWRTLLPLLRK